MAGYDTSIRVNTKVDNADLKKLETEIQGTAKKMSEGMEEAGRAADNAQRRMKQQEGSWDSLTHKAEDYKTRLKDMENKGFGLGDEKYDEMYIAWQNAENALSKYKATLNQKTDKGLEDQATKAAKEQEAALKKIQSRFSEAKKSGNKFFSALQKGSKQTNGLFKTISARLKGLSLSLLIFNWISKGFNAMVKAMQEGFQNVAQYSKDYNNAMSELKGQAAQLKNGLAAAFEPVVSIIIPYLTQLVSKLNSATNTLGQFFAALQGKNTYTKAKQQVIDYAKSLDKASGAAKGALASFDSINVLSEDESSNGGETTGEDAFETAEVGASVVTAIGEMQAVIQPFKDLLTNLTQGIDFAPLLNSLNALKTACSPFVGYIYNGLLWLIQNVLTPLSTWTMQDALPAFIGLLASGMSALDTVLTTLKPTFDYIWNEILKPIGEFSGEIFLWSVGMIKDAFSGLSELFEEKGDKINLILTTIGNYVQLMWQMRIKPVLQFAMGFLKTLFQYIITVAGDLIDVFAGIIEFVSDVFAGDWEAAWEDIVDVFKGIFNTIVDVFEGIINSIISGINNISIDVPDWVPGIGGKTYGFDIEEIDIPRLATGGITNGPTKAIIGEAGREAVLPLENNTEWMDVLADKVTPNVTIRFMGTLSELGRVLKPVIDTESSRVGTSFMTI